MLTIGHLYKKLIIFFCEYLVYLSISVLNRVEPLRGAGRKGGIEVRFIGNLTQVMQGILLCVTPLVDPYAGENEEPNEE